MVGVVKYFKLMMATCIRNSIFLGWGYLQKMQASSYCTHSGHGYSSGVHAGVCHGVHVGHHCSVLLPGSDQPLLDVRRRVKVLAALTVAPIL